MNQPIPAILRRHLQAQLGKAPGDPAKQLTIIRDGDRIQCEGKRAHVRTLVEFAKQFERLTVEHFRAKPESEEVFATAETMTLHGDKGAAARAEAEWANVIDLRFGQIVEVDGKAYQFMASCPHWREVSNPFFFEPIAL